MSITEVSTVYLGLFALLFRFSPAYLLTFSLKFCSGVPNFVLINEDPTLASCYKNKSIAEQNSVDLSWNTLMDPSFKNLRKCIYSNESELRRFRQLVVNSVMATDIFDKDLGELRKERWVKAFSETAPDNNDRKATIVIEHLIQASDVAHTMQHFHIYLKCMFTQRERCRFGC